MRRLGAILAMAMLLALTVAVPAEAARPAPIQDPYISRITGTVSWVQDTVEPFTWWYVLKVSVVATGLPKSPLYDVCAKLTYHPSEVLITTGYDLTPAPNPRVRVTSQVDIQFGGIEPGSRSITLTEQLMRVGQRGCCTNVGPLLTVNAELPKVPPAHGQTVVIFDLTYTTP